MATRPDRDSGINQLDDSNLPVISDDDYTDAEDDINMAQQGQGNPGQAAQVPVNPPPVVPRPQQLANIPLFDGERGEGFINWLEALENAKDAYGWVDDHLVGVAKARGGPKIAEWLRGLRLQGVNHTVWLTDAGLRAALKKRFGPKYTSATAVHSVSDLKQRNSESCASFLDRVLLAVDRMHFNVTDAQKQEAGYRRVFISSVLMHFGAGVKTDIGKVILGRAVPPATIAEMLTAAEAVEAEISKRGAPGDSALAITDSSEDTPEEPSDLEQLTRQVEGLTDLVGAIAAATKKPFDFRNIRCYRCNQMGHFQNKCQNEPKRSAGPNRRMQFQTRRGQQRAFRRPSRPQFAIEQDQEAEDEPDEENPEQESEELWETSGNF